jgi:hypothetical protein
MIRREGAPKGAALLYADESQQETENEDFYVSKKMKMRFLLCLYQNVFFT